MTAQGARALCAGVVAVALTWSGAGVPALAQGVAAPDPVSASIEGDGRFQGKIQIGSQGKTRAAKGAVVYAFDVSTGILYASEPTGGSGKFSLEGLRRGYYDVGIELQDGQTFVANRVLEMKPSGKVVATLILTPSGELAPEVAATAVRFPGNNSPAAGIAQVKKKPRGKEFWTSTKGILIIGAAGIVALAAIATQSPGESDSPQNPQP